MPARIFVFIPVYNAAAYVAETIESVLSQTYTDWELLILDDQSTDNSFELCKSFEKKDPRITVAINDKNLGMMANWNEGIDFCLSEYFVKLDADDIWEPTMLEKAIVILETHKDVGLVFSNYININEYGKTIEGTKPDIPDFASNNYISCKDLVLQGPDKMLSYPIMRQGVSVMRKKIFDIIGKYSSINSADTEFYFRLGLHYKIYIIDEPLYLYRIHNSSDSTQIAKNDKRPFLLHEVKTSIINYYREKGVITDSQYSRFFKKINFDYNVYLTVRYRKEMNIAATLKILVLNFFNSPIYFLQFYWNRIVNR